MWNFHFDDVCIIWRLYWFVEYYSHSRVWDHPPSLFRIDYLTRSTKTTTERKMSYQTNTKCTKSTFAQKCLFYSMDNYTIKDSIMWEKRRWILIWLAPSSVGPKSRITMAEKHTKAFFPNEARCKERHSIIPKCNTMNYNIPSRKRCLYCRLLCQNRGG